ncbi:dehydrogenase/reductase SDR family member 7-like [Chironomus tepperi]|uniref:dehydrogenase/reductase SDR family member 7-like n=1 Tax=Chironomus tepperi TaxID=113505 RepID=UPI00391EE7E3
MGLLAAIGLIVIIYYIVQFFLWTILDCDIELFIASILGKPISNLKGKVVWITGASSGIGRELAKVLSKNGVRLVLTARNSRELEATKQECLVLAGGALNSDDVLVIPLDMLKFAYHQDTFNRVVQHFRGLHILVNNAGRSQRAEWNKIDINVDRELFELDVFSVIHLSRLAVTYFEQNNIKGQLAVTSSTAGLIGAPNSASYTGAKHAIHGYFEALRNEKPNINVNIYCPGPTFSNFLQEAFVEIPGQKYNQPVQSDDKRMTAERCAYLYAVALANNTGLCWSGIFPINWIAYIGLYYPNIKRFLLAVVGTGRLKKIRDGRYSNSNDPSRA